MFDQLKSLAVFAKVAEIGSFTGAAKVLGITAPVVSQHLSQLEKDLEVALVYRSTRSLRLTDAGEKLAISARAMLDEAENGIDEIINDEAEPHGKLSIAAPGIADYDPFMNGLTRYIKKYPDVELSISFDDKIRDLIREGFDLGIRGSMALDDSTLISRKLIDNPMLLACTPEYIEQRGMVSRPEDLQKNGYQWIGGPLRGKTVTLRTKLDPNEKVEIPISRSIEVDNYKASLNLGLRGNGLVSISVLDHLDLIKDGTFIEPLPEWEFESMGIYAVWPANAGARSLTRHFLNFMLTEIEMGKAAKAKLNNN